MSIGDPIADLLTRIRNAQVARLRYVELPSTKLLVELVNVLKDQGFIDGFLVREDKPQGVIRIYLRYASQREPVIQGLTRVSKSSRRRYVGFRAIPKVFGGMGISILSTSQGVMVGEEARERKVGGEVLCYVW